MTGPRLSMHGYMRAKKMTILFTLCIFDERRGKHFINE